MGTVPMVSPAQARGRCALLSDRLGAESKSVTRIRKHSYQGLEAARALADLKSPASFSAVVGGLGLAVLGVALIVRAEERGQSVCGGFTVLFGLLAARDRDRQGLWGRVRGPVFALAGQAVITSLYAGGGAFGQHHRSLASSSHCQRAVVVVGCLCIGRFETRSRLAETFLP
jgi:hypothetical protein